MYVYSADFETTTDPEDCRVWAWAVCNIEKTDNIKIGNSIDTFMEWILKQDGNIVYFHNLKFDGTFIMHWLFKNGYEHVISKDLAMLNTFTTLISDKNVFYSIEIYSNNVNRPIKIYDSLKILPMSVDQIAKTFKLDISKLEIDYEKFRPVNYSLSESEKEYITHDVKIIAVALKEIRNQGLKKITIGANALYSFKKIVSQKRFEEWFPTPYNDDFIRKSYKGGYTYVNEKIQGKDLGAGIVLDVNSLYPSVMYYNDMPYGEPIYYEGEYKQDKIYNIFVQHLFCQFELKENHIPTIQIKNNLSFIPTQYLKSSNGELVELYLTSVDLKLFFSHYDVYDITYIDGYKYKSSNKIFREYIEKWMEVKSKATIEGNAGLRTIAKLMLNNLYGKLALNPKCRQKIPYLDDGVIKYINGEEETRKGVYIAGGVFVTAYARYKTITSAQKLYDRFLYSDTDSLHLLGTDLPSDLEIDDVKLGAWAHEKTFKKARFLRAKAYIEETDKLDITCAGMPYYCHSKVNWDNFKIGAEYDGKLRHVNVKGGVVLLPTTYIIRK